MCIENYCTIIDTYSERFYLIYMSCLNSFNYSYVNTFVFIHLGLFELVYVLLLFCVFLLWYQILRRVLTFMYMYLLLGHTHCKNMQNLRSNNRVIATLHKFPF